MTQNELLLFIVSTAFIFWIIMKIGLNTKKDNPKNFSKETQTEEKPDDEIAEQDPGEPVITVLLEEEEDIKLEHPAFDPRDFHFLVGSTLLNPFGPTMDLLGFFGDASARTGLWLIMLNPTTSTIRKVGEIDTRAEIEAEDLEKLIAVWDEACFDQVFIADEMPRETGRAFLRSFYESRPGDTVEKLALIEAFPDFPMERFEFQAGRSGNTLLRRPVPESVERMVERSLGKSYLREVKTFLLTWKLCEDFFLSPNGLRANYPMEKTVPLMLRVCPQLSSVFDLPADCGGREGSAS